MATSANLLGCYPDWAVLPAVDSPPLAQPQGGILGIASTNIVLPSTPGQWPTGASLLLTLVHLAFDDSSYGILLPASGRDAPSCDTFLASHSIRSASGDLL